LTAKHSGSLFGDAIYFSDNFEKSFEYTSKDDITKDEHCYMLVCEVALGNIANFPQTWSDEVYRPPEGSHSVRIMTSVGPDFRQSTYCKIKDLNEQDLPTPVVIPAGPHVKYPPPKI